MGRDKAALPFGPETLLERVLRLVRPQVDDVVIAAGARQGVPSGFTVVRDASPGLGPLPALHHALGHVKHDWTFVVACDAPLLQPGIIPRLLGLATGWEAAIPTIDGMRMTACAVYGTSPALRHASALAGIGSAGLHDLTDRLRARSVSAAELKDADPSLLSFTPCNTPEEYRHALALAGLKEHPPRGSAP